MLSISHSLTGAFIATAIPNPFISTPLIFVAHYAQDWIPHWDVGTGLSHGKRRKFTALGLELIDLGLTAILVFLLWQLGQKQINFLAWWGAGVALVPDFMEAPRNFLKWDPKIFKSLNDFHFSCHHSTPHFWLGILPQVAIWLTIGFLVVRGMG